MTNITASFVYNLRDYVFYSEVVNILELLSAGMQIYTKGNGKLHDCPLE